MDSTHDCINHACTSIKVGEILADEYGELSAEDAYFICDFRCCCDRSFTLFSFKDALGNTCLTELKADQHSFLGYIMKSPQPYFVVRNPLCGKVCRECNMQKCTEFLGKDETLCNLCCAEIFIQ